MLRDQIFKAKEIFLFYFNRYLDLSITPEADNSFILSFNDDKSALKRLLSEDVDKHQVTLDANRICDGELKLYDIDSKTFINGINRHSDYYSGHEWPLLPFNRIYDPNDSGFDLNVPFELSRLQFIPALMQASMLTHSSKYHEKMTGLIDDWIAENPYCFGVNWWSPMEVGLRAVNLVLAFAYIINTCPEKDAGPYLKLLWKHALYIYKYDVILNRVKNRNNHFLGSMLGLLTVSMCFKGKQATRLFDYAFNALMQEIPRQFMDDGGNFESATGYHQFSLEAVLVAILFLRQYNNDGGSEDFVEKLFGKDIQERLIKAVNLVYNYMTCYGRSPHFGDSSDCRVLILNDYLDRKACDHSFLYKLAGKAINYKMPPQKNNSASLFPVSGYACYKNNIYGLISFAGPKGTNGSGGHGHNDKCSFVLQAGGDPVMVDSGTYIYNSGVNERFYYKKTIAHNTIIIDDLEQCEITPARVFGLNGKIQPKIAMAETDEGVYIRMEYDGYSALGENGPGQVIREIKCLKDSIELNDTIDGTGIHQVSISFNLHPTAECYLDKNIVVIKSNHLKQKKIILKGDWQFTVTPSLYSGAYHKEVHSMRLLGHRRAELPVSFRTTIEFF